MGTISVSLPSDGDTIDVSDYNTPITTVVNEINGNLDNANIDAAAAIDGSKLADNSVTTDKVSNAYMFSANSQAAQNSGNGAFAKVLFATEEYDYNNNYASSTYTAPVAGVYHFDANIRTAAANTIFIVSLFKNGAEAKRGMDSRQASVSAQGSVLSTDILLAASDTVEIYSFANASLALSVAPAEMYFSGRLVRETP